MNVSLIHTWLTGSPFHCTRCTCNWLTRQSANSRETSNGTQAEIAYVNWWNVNFGPTNPSTLYAHYWYPRTLQRQLMCDCVRRYKEEIWLAEAAVSNTERKQRKKRKHSPELNFWWTLDSLWSPSWGGSSANPGRQAGPGRCPPGRASRAAWWAGLV